jgi:hypothetical protein
MPRGFALAAISACAQAFTSARGMAFGEIRYGAGEDREAR